MNGHDSDKIEGLVIEALARIEEGGPSAIEEICREHPESADALRVRLEWLMETGLAAGPADAEGVQELGGDATEFPERLGDFRLIEPIGKGGMGVVYRAEQVSLGREVALKLVRPENLYFPGARERFEREVTTVAALAHPGIVPVFSVGNEAGVPFFAMEHVRGASIGDVLRELDGHSPGVLEGKDVLATLDKLGSDPAEPSSNLFEGSWPTVCARIGREVAEALEHAHRRGVLHRDVKPTNVMLTRGGRVMLVDFGLSSQQAAEDRRTRTGQAVGTLAYMAPEQLRGEKDLDARADVYALGVTLYEMLTLRLPADAGSGSKRLTAADAPLPADMRRLDPRVPWELETVMQTAADPDPARRYATAADLARDLDNVLENRPIEARRASPWLRARRWVQRHPTTALALLVVLVGPSLLAVQELRANRALSAKSIELAASNEKLGRALDEANLQREAARAAQARAEEHFDRAYEAIEAMLGRVGGEVLESVPGAESIRHELLRDALRLQEEMLADPEGDRRQQQLHAVTLRRIAALRAELGDLEASLAALDEAAGVLDQLLAEAPDADVDHERGLVDHRRAEMSKLLERMDQALAFARLAVERFERLHAAAPGTQTLERLAGARNELADILSRTGDEEAARAELEEMVALLGELYEQGQADWMQRRALAEALHLMAGYPEHVFVAGSASDGAFGDSDYDVRRGEDYLRTARELRQELHAERPHDHAVMSNLATTAQALGNTLLAQMRVADAEEALGEANALFAQLAADYPARPSFTEGLATTCYNLSLVAGVHERPEERERLLRSALETYETLTAQHPDFVPYRRQLVLTLAQLGQAIFSTGGDPDEAEEMLRRSLELGIPIWENTPDEGLRTSLAWSNGILAALLATRDDPYAVVDAALGYLDLEPRPLELAWGASFLARAVALGRRTGVAAEDLRAWTDEAMGLLESALDQAPDDPLVQKELTEPELEVFAGDERFEALLEAFSGQ